MFAAIGASQEAPLSVERGEESKCGIVLLIENVLNVFYF